MHELGLERGAGADEVRDAYRRVSRKVEATGAAAAARREAEATLKVARGVLGAEESRRRYLDAGAAGERAGTWRRYKQSERLAAAAAAARAEAKEAKRKRRVEETPAVTRTAAGEARQGARKAAKYKAGKAAKKAAKQGAKRRATWADGAAAQ